MDPLIDLSELAKARIQAKEAKAKEQGEIAMRACERDFEMARHMWGGYTDLHRGELQAATDEAASNLDQVAILRACYVFSAHAVEYGHVLSHPGELAAVLGRLREAVVREYGERTRASVECLEAAKIEEAQRKCGAMKPVSPGNPVFENPFPGTDSRHSILAPHFEFMEEFSKLEAEYPELSMEWKAASATWMPWPPPYRAVREGEGTPSSPGGDLHVQRSASEAAERLLGYSGARKAEAVLACINPGRDRWLQTDGWEPWQFGLYALREFWLNASEEAAASGADISSFERIAEEQGYLPGRSTPIGSRVWSAMVTQRKSLDEVITEQQLSPSQAIGSMEEPAGWVQDGKITNVFKAFRYFCGVLAARRARDLFEEVISKGSEVKDVSTIEKVTTGVLPGEDPFEVTRRGVLEQTVSSAQEYIAARRALGIASTEQLVLDAWRDCVVPRQLGIWLPDFAEFSARLMQGSIPPKQPGPSPVAESRSDSAIPCSTDAPEDRLALFMQQHPGATYADVRYSAKVHKPDFQDWRRGKLPPTSVMRERIDDVLSGKTELRKKPRKPRED